MSWISRPSFLVCDNCQEKRNADSFDPQDSSWFNVDRTPHSSIPHDENTLDLDFCSTKCLAEFFGAGLDEMWDGKEIKPSDVLDRHKIKEASNNGDK